MKFDVGKYEVIHFGQKNIERQYKIVGRLTQLPGDCFAMETITKRVLQMIVEGRAVDVDYMDFTKAFDKIPNGRLVQKIKRHGIH
eukprot:g20391.t1